MHCANSIKRGEIYAVIEANPGITKSELMRCCGIGIKALEMHLVRMVADREVHSEAIANRLARSWHVGPPEAPALPRVASVFNLGHAMVSA